MAMPPEIGHACAHGQVGVVEAWLNSDSAHHPDIADDHWPTDLLFTAVQNPLDRDDMIRMLIAKGASVEARCDKGWTPLMHAASFSARALDDRAFDRVRGRYLPTRYDYWYSYEAPDEVIMG